MFELNPERPCLKLAPIAAHIDEMSDHSTKKHAGAVRDELEQALYSLPRVSVDDERIALLIEKAVDIATEMEFSQPVSGRRVGPGKKPHRP